MQHELCCNVECGALLIYTGNQTDAVALVSVCTDCYADHSDHRLDDSSLDGADAVAIANSKFNQDEHLHLGNRPVDLHRPRQRRRVDRQDQCGGQSQDRNRRRHRRGGAGLPGGRHDLRRLGGGNYDVLTVSNCTATDEIFDGGDGNGDLLNYKHLNNHFTNAPSISGFETVV